MPPKIAWRLSLQTVGYILQALKFDMNISTPMKYWESVAKIIRLKYWENFALMPPKEQNDERSVATDDDQGGEAGNKKLTGEGQSQCLKRRTNNAECKELCEGCFIVYKTCGVDAVLSKWNQGKEASQPITTPSGANSVTNTSDNP